MQGTYDIWLVGCSFLVAVLASYVALELAARVAGSRGRAAWIWIAFGSAAMGLGIWSMHFVGMQAFHLPIALAYDVSITLLSVVPAVLSAALVLCLVRRGNVTGFRLALASVVLGGGIAAMHYSGMAAIPVVPAIRYDPLIFAASVAIAIAVAFVALKLAFSLSGTGARSKKFAAAIVMGAAISAMHYTGMAAARFSPDAVCIVAPGAIGQLWLAGIIAFNTVVVLLMTVAIAFYDARLADQNARAAQQLKFANEELRERTRRAETAELGLRESEARFRRLTELSSDWYWEQDENLRFTWMSGGVLTKLGWDPDLFIGKSRWDFPIVAADDALARHKALLAEHKEFHDFVYGRRNSDGTLSYVSASGMPLYDDKGNFRGYRGIGKDVTERVRKEAQILRSQEQLRLALEASKLAQFEWNLQSGEVFLSDRWAEIIGCALGPTRTNIQALTDMIHPEDAHSVKSLVYNLIKGHTAFYEAEHRFKTASGDYIWVQSHGKVVERDAGGKAVRVSGTNADISERKNSEQALRDAYDKLGSGVSILEQRNREITLLAELSNFLLSCVTVEEACNAVPKYCESLFPGENGGLYLFKASRDYLVPSTSWGGPKDEVPSFKPEDCWALRRGKPHMVSDPQKDAICGHIAVHEQGKPYMCIPLVVQSDLLGLMWITLADPASSGSGTDAARNGRVQLAVTLSEQIALALSNIRLRENLRQQTIRDALTGLYNRRFLEESLNREIARCNRNAKVFAVLMIDVDHFKRFNDTYGHDAGDSALRAVGGALQKGTREGDIVCRFGGEEFVVLLPDTNLEGATLLAQRILEFVRRLEITHNGKTLPSITASLGLSMYPQNGETGKALIQAADKVLYEAKGAGRDRLVASL
jgi:diguanylate cyclase (GGDEF)-like protein/PAS domain S-box-containing protein